MPIAIFTMRKELHGFLFLCMHVILVGRMTLSSGETVLYSGRDDDQHMQGMAIMMNQGATKTLIDWSPINERMIKARFYSKFVKVTMIHVYAPTNDADEQTKEDLRKTTRSN